MDKDATHRLENYQFPDKFGQWLGYKIARFDREKHEAETILEIREDHLSPAGRVHGGAISAFFDYACGAAVFSTMEAQDLCSTVELKVHYFYPIELGQKLRALSRVVFQGKRLCVVEAKLYRDGKEEPIAMATSTFNVVRQRGKQQQPHSGKGQGPS